MNTVFTILYVPSNHTMPDYLFLLRVLETRQESVDAAINSLNAGRSVLLNAAQTQLPLLELQRAGFLRDVLPGEIAWQLEIVSFDVPAEQRCQAYHQQITTIGKKLYEIYHQGLALVELFEKTTTPSSPAPDWTKRYFSFAEFMRSARGSLRALALRAFADVESTDDLEKKIRINIGLCLPEIRDQSGALDEMEYMATISRNATSQELTDAAESFMITAEAFFDRTTKSADQSVFEDAIRGTYSTLNTYAALTDAHPSFADKTPGEKRVYSHLLREIASGWSKDYPSTNIQ
jgi:hypothetical protein